MTAISAVPGSAPITIPASILTTAAGAPSTPEETGLHSSAALQAAAYTTALQSGLVTTPPDDAPWYDSHTKQINLDSKEAVKGFETWVKNGAGDSSHLSADLNNFGTNVDDYWYERTAPNHNLARTLNHSRSSTESSKETCQAI